MTLRRQLEPLQRLTVKLHDDLVCVRNETHLVGIVEIAAVGVLVIQLGIRQMMLPEASVFYVPFQLPGVGLTLAMLVALRAAPARQRTNAWHPYVVDQVIRIAARIGRGSVFVAESRQAQPSPQ